MKGIAVTILFAAFSCCTMSSAFAQSNFPKGLTFMYDTPPAPAMQTTDVDNNRFDLADLRNNVVLINFWATWCPPCLEELPSLQKSYDTLKSKGYKVLAVNTGETPEHIKEFLQEFDTTLSFDILLDETGKLFKDWKLRVLPTSFIVDKQGRLYYKTEGPRDFASDHIQEKLLELLNQ